jgi:hypothetical protein
MPNKVFARLFFSPENKELLLHELNCALTRTGVKAKVCEEKNFLSVTGDSKSLDAALRLLGSADGLAFYNSKTDNYRFHKRAFPNLFVPFVVRRGNKPQIDYFYRPGRGITGIRAGLLLHNLAELPETSALVYYPLGGYGGDYAIASGHFSGLKAVAGELSTGRATGMAWRLFSLDRRRKRLGGLGSADFYHASKDWVDSAKSRVVFPVLADATEPPLKDGVFHAAIIDPPHERKYARGNPTQLFFQVVASCHRVLKPGGVVVARVPSSWVQATQSVPGFELELMREFGKKESGEPLCILKFRKR